MKHFACAIALPVLIATLTCLQIRAIAQPTPPAAGAPDQNRALLDTYCVTCHNTRTKIGGIAFDALDLHAAADDAQIWEKALHKLRGRLMPPPGAPQPAQKDIDSFVSWMENTLDSHPKGPTAGHVPVQRLNRTEYTASVKALVGVDVNPKDVLPQDIQIDGFDNVAVALSVSPSFLSQYITAARQIAKLAVGTPNPRVSNVRYSSGANQNPDLPLPPGTRGGMGFKHNFPADGEYRFSFIDLGVAQALYTGPLENETTLVLLIDGKVVMKKPVGGPADLELGERKAGAGRAEILSRFQKIPIQVHAGVHNVAVAFIDHSHVESDENVAGGFGGGGGRMPAFARDDGVEIVGPFDPKGVSPTPSRDLIFICDPKKTAEAACARQITENLARRAYRRPVSADDMASLMPFYEAGRKEGGSFDEGVEQVVAAVLASPDFLYRAIRGRGLHGAGAPPDTEFALTDLELASRLSFFLWNTGPDDELLKLAASGGLSKPGVIEAEVKRMLADPRASSLVTSFAVKWLNLDGLDSVKPDPVLFPGFNEQLRHDFLHEAEAFVGSILLEDRSVVDLLTADHTFLNDRLARHYGISGVTGAQFRRVTLTAKERYGILGKAAVLMRTSYGDRTSPVLRGAWVLDKLIGTPPTPPPPNTATDLSQAAGEAPKTVRARLEQHRDKATCRQCHGVIDPTGLALENFDAIGQFRTADRQAANAPIDASTVLPNGTPINGPVELRAQLADRPATFVEALTERLLMYAVNREPEYFDMPQIRAIVRGASKDNYKLSAIVLGIVNSDAFRKQAPAVATKQSVQKSGTQAIAAK
jgi:mono/diheme cytochrome c family protein